MSDAIEAYPATAEECAKALLSDFRFRKCAEPCAWQVYHRYGRFIGWARRVDAQGRPDLNGTFEVRVERDATHEWRPFGSKLRAARGLLAMYRATTVRP